MTTSPLTAVGGPGPSALEVDLILDGVRVSCRHELEPLGARPELVPAPDQIAEVTRAARDHGLVGEDVSPLWAGTTDDDAALSLASLALLAEAQAGLAFHLHQLALTDLLARRTDTVVAPGTVPALEGTGGLARGALARLLAGAAPAADDETLLSAAHPADDGAVLLQAAEPWTHVLLPRHLGAGSLALEVVARDATAATPLGAGHGLDGIRWWQLDVPGGAGTTVAEGAAARAALTTALTATALALPAIGLGALTGAWARVWPYSRDRVQGGRPIREHPAVAQLLAEARSTLALARAALARPPALESFDGLVEAVALRAGLHPPLCTAATALVQVLGGYGYMRDQGAEACLRDNQHLRLSTGAPSQLALFLVAAEELR
jgi:hypothetical protein